MRVVDGKSYSNISADQTFTLETGGLYGLDVTATWGGGNVTLKKLAADGSTYVAVADAITADGAALYDLPAGIYKFDLTTATAMYITLRRIPGE